jgi:hypothetical protein
VRTKLEIMIRILRYEDRQEWKNILSDMDASDIFFSPEYLKVNETIIRGESECFVYRDKDSLVLYSYLRRPIEGSALFDITSPYGYGGYVKLPNNSTAERFHAAFCRYCREKGIVGEFIRFHPLYNNHLYTNDNSLQLICHQPVVIVDYNKEGFSLKETIQKDALKKIRKADRNQISVIEDVNWDYYQGFIEMYKHTMDLKRASAFYYFNDDFFESLKIFLSDHSLLFVALYRDRVIGGLLILYGSLYAYNYLSCSDYNYNRLGTNDLLQFKALDWAYKRGLKTYLLGGGMKEEDSLFRFKAKFSKQRTNFFIGKRVHLPQAYAKLCQEKIRREGSRAEEFFSRSWFPLYRSNPPRQKGANHDV